MTTLAVRHATTTTHPSAFDGIVCAVDGAAGGEGAVAAAIALAPSAAWLEVVCVGAGADSLEERRGRQALAAARLLATERGVAAATEVVHGADAAGALLARAGAQSLLVAAGRAPEPRRRGLDIGPLATALVARAAGPVLVARAHPAGAPRILAAVDDGDGARAVARLAGLVAVGCGGFVHLVHAAGQGYGPATRHRLAELATDLIALTGAEPVVDIAVGMQPAARICDLARVFESSLVVVGRRSRGGLRSLGSVSERVAQGAPCSVLVAPVTAPPRAA